MKEEIDIKALMIGGVLIAALFIAPGNCEDIELDLGKENICLTEKEYGDAKTALLDEYTENKEYDFGYDSLPLLSAVLSKEVSEKGIVIDSGADKDTIREQLLLLLESE